MPPKSEEYLYPWNLPESITSLFQFGYLGVNLFFTISGYVITQSLDSSKSFSIFWGRRFARIWPSLVIVMLCFYLFGRIINIGSTQGISISIPALFSSVTIVDPRILSLLLSSLGTTTWITDVLWSLWVEIIFYLLMSVLFYKANLKTNTTYISIFMFIFSLNSIDYFYPAFFPENPSLDALTEIRHYILWFCVGFMAFKVTHEGRIGKLWMVSCLLLNLVVENFRNLIDNFSSHLFVSIIIIIFQLLFLPAVLTLKIDNTFTGLLGKIGNISFEIYLTHEFLLLAVITMPQLHTMRNYSLWVLIPYLVLVFFLSYIVKSKVSDSISARIRARFG